LQALVVPGVTPGAKRDAVERRTTMIHEYAAIDPMALLFPSRLYIEMSEKLHPQVPKPVEIKQALGRLTAEEKQYILVRARMLANYSRAVEEAVIGSR
jgi:hypothetical protein